MTVYAVDEPKRKSKGKYMKLGCATDDEDDRVRYNPK